MNLLKILVKQGFIIHSKQQFLRMYVLESYNATMSSLVPFKVVNFVFFVIDCVFQNELALLTTCYNTCYIKRYHTFMGILYHFDSYYFQHITRIVTVRLPPHIMCKATIVADFATLCQALLIFLQKQSSILPFSNLDSNA